MALARRDALSVEERAAASVAICDAANALLGERVAPGAVVAYGPSWQEPLMFVYGVGHPIEPVPEPARHWVPL